MVLDILVDAEEIILSGEKEVSIPIYININIEVQHDDDDDHVKRLAYNAGMVKANKTPKGSQFADVRNVWVILISGYDPILTKEERDDKSLRKQLYSLEGDLCDRIGISYWLANSSVSDSRLKNTDSRQKDIRKLMKIFTRSNAYDDTLCPAFSREKRNFKVHGNGVNEMCRIVQELINKATEKAEMEKNAAIEEKNAAVKQRNAAVRLLAQALNLSEEEAQARVVQVAATGC